MARAAITKDNLSPLVEVVVWFCLVLAILTVLVRFMTKHYFLHRFELDDFFCLISLVWLWRPYEEIHFEQWLMIEDLCLRSVNSDLDCGFVWPRAAP